MRVRSIELIAGVVSLLVAIVLCVVLYFGDLFLPHWVALVVILLLLVYHFTKYALTILIDTRIKPLYQFIGSHPQKKSAGTTSKSIALLEGEIRTWAERSKDEMNTLRTMETYRKEFLGNVSHELKTPLFSLQGYIDTLKTIPPDDGMIREKYLDRCDKNIERLINIVCDLEEMSRLESNALILYRTNFDIVLLLREVTESLESIFAECSVRLKPIELLPIMVNADRARIEQVLINLLTNAAKYNVGGGMVEVRFTDMFDKVMVEVVDTGVGIAQDHLPRLFERFYRIDKARSRSHGGTGLGLAIVKHILEAHHETIGVRSTQGVGTTFYFMLPKQ